MKRRPLPEIDGTREREKRRVAPGLAGAMLLAGVVGLGACSTNEPDEPAPPDDPVAASPVDTVTIEDALAAFTDEWMAVDGVEGTGIGLCEETPCIKVFVSRPPEEFADVLPDSVHGHPVRLEPSGRFKAQ